MSGRPSDFSEATADAICAGLADGRSLRKICLDEGMPSQTTVFRWLADERYATFREQYVRAREAQADALFDECLDIADDGSNDYMGEDDTYNGDAVARSRLRIDTRKWMAGKLRPKVYGDKLELNNNHGLQDSLGDLLKAIDGRSKGLPNG